MKWPSRYVVRRTAVVTIIAATISISVSTGIRMLVGAEADGITIAVRITLPFLIAIPLGLVWFSKLESLERSYRELLKRSADLAKSASTDPLTGLLNRRSFEAQFDLAQTHGVTGYFLIADVDYLKAINDRYGHPVGDDAIMSAAVALQKVLPPESLIARIGGDEFCAFVPARDAVDADKISVSINSVALLEFRRRTNLTDEKLSVSIGHMTTRPGLTLRSAISGADQRLYRRKGDRPSVRRMAGVQG